MTFKTTFTALIFINLYSVDEIAYLTITEEHSPFEQTEAAFHKI
jgi:hypothetical protein